MAIEPGAGIEVHLRNDSDQTGGRVTTGAFRSADADAITLTLADGQVRTLERQAVRRVRARRPFFDRPAGWRAYLIITGVMTGLLAWASTEDNIPPSSYPLMAAAMFPAALPFFAATPMGTIYEAQPIGFITAVDVNTAEGAVIQPGHVVMVSMEHSIRSRRPGGRRIGITACLSSDRERCTGAIARNEGRAAELPSPFTARFQVGDLFPYATPLPMYVHVVIVGGSSWRPVGDMRVPRSGDRGVLDAVTVTRRVTVVER